MAGQKRDFLRSWDATPEFSSGNQFKRNKFKSNHDYDDQCKQNYPLPFERYSGIQHQPKIFEKFHNPMNLAVDYNFSAGGQFQNQATSAVNDNLSAGNLFDVNYLKQACNFVPMPPSKTNVQNGFAVSSNNSKLNDYGLRNSEDHQHEKSDTRPEDSGLKSVPDRTQKRAIQAVLDGDNVFITGPAGTGKSFLLKLIKAELENLGKNIAVVGSTGLAAVNVGGITLHSFAGCGIPKSWSDFQKCWKNKSSWRQTDTLILDECSMIPAEFIDALDSIVCELRNNNSAFGGIQLIFIGDFAQLPPISNSNDGSLYDIKLPRQQFLSRGLLFQSKLWKDANFKVCVLETMYRQADPQFRHVLNDLRLGNVSPAAEQLFGVQCVRPLSESEGVIPTKLYATNINVDMENDDELRHLPGSTKVYYAYDQERLFEGVPPSQSYKLDYQKKKFLLVQERLTLKKGAQVMLLKNIYHDGELVLFNGSRGLVVKCKEDCVKVRFTNGITKKIEQTTFTVTVPNVGEVERRQIPLKLAWALTMHKSQGQTLDRVVVNLNSTRLDYGQTYVALSRARSKEGLQVIGFSPDKVSVHPLVLQFYQSNCSLDGIPPAYYNSSSHLQISAANQLNFLQHGYYY